jgi:TPR repeat protein
MYGKGLGVPKDPGEAIKWYRLAAEQGHASAQNNLGLLLANGEGAPQDYVQAYKWLILSAVQGDANAAANRKAVALKMTSGQVDAAQEMAREWRPGAGR